VSEKQLKGIYRPALDDGLGSGNAHNAWDDGFRDFRILVIEPLQNVDRVEIESGLVRRGKFLDLHLRLARLSRLPDINQRNGKGQEKDENQKL
jgi:hypothetical protein